MALTRFGEKTKSIFLKNIEAHKLHQEFEVAEGETIKKGQPVALNDDGEVISATALDAYKVIGISIHDGTEGQFITVGMRAFSIVWAKPAAALVAGPVTYNGQNTVEDGIYGTYIAATDATKLHGWALDNVAANGRTRVALLF